MSEYVLVMIIRYYYRKKLEINNIIIYHQLEFNKAVDYQIVNTGLYLFLYPDIKVTGCLCVNLCVCSFKSTTIVLFYSEASYR